MNKTLGIVLAAIGGVLLIAGISLMIGYNGLVTKREMVKTKWADVQAQYQRRMDLIPNVVTTVKTAADTEQRILQGVVNARSAWATAKMGGDINAQIKAASGFDSAMSHLLVTVEAYPQLKSIEGFGDLTTNLEGTENRVAVARRDYNEAVRVYNTASMVFPGSMIAALFSFAPFQSFEADAGAQNAPKVDFNSPPLEAPAVEIKK